MEGKLTPDRPKRVPLGDVTPPPVLPILNRRNANSALQQLDRRGTDDSRQLKRQQTDINLQRFTLRSRRSTPYPEVAGQPTVKALSPVNSLRRSSELPVALVRLCNCTWRGPLVAGKSRLCQQDTEDHDEYRLLEAMVRRFSIERQSQGEQASTNVARLAADQKLQVHFILEPMQEVVIGYVAVEKVNTTKECATELRLHQVYVEKECRKMGFATTALRSILGRGSAVLLEAPTPAAALLMDKIGFIHARQLFLTDDEEAAASTGWTRFYPAFPCAGREEDQWGKEIMSDSPLTGTV